MKKMILLIITPVLILSIGLSGCGTTAIPEATPTTPNSTDTAAPATPTTTITTTPDPCEAENIKPVVDQVHAHMREFDDASTLAASLPREQLTEPIANLQRIRREAEDETVPSCLENLKDFQIQHMNSVISTLLAFISASDPLALDCVDVVENTQEAAVCQSISNARQQHDQYTLELARLLNIPIFTAPAVTPPLENSSP
ncbi:MAG TPA: hypothetical protein VJ821_18470 [Anaerolineales bacterium]|nr:hypothetical protein [Anaerolineales bacterium]